MGGERGLSLFAGVAGLFDLVDLPAPGVPARFSMALPGEALLAMPHVPPAALPEAGRIASGRGLDAASCRASCLGEAAELLSCCEWGTETLVTTTAAQIGPAGIDPDRLNGFTPAQTAGRAAWNGEYGSFDWRPAPPDPAAALDWLAVEDAFGGAPAFIPADFAFIGRRQPGDEAAVAIGDSNGCAAGADADAARLAAVLELVERDATGRWWYGRRLRAPRPLRLPGAAALAKWLAKRARRTWLFDITTDLAVPVMAAASAEPDGRDVALGFAARLDPQAAAIQALTEMLQMEISLSAAREFGDPAGDWSRWRDSVRMTLPPLAAALRLPPEPLSPEPGDGSLPGVLDALAEHRIDLWFADMTRREIGVPVFRAVSTALCHCKPRLARPRLLAADPGDRGYEPADPGGQPPLLV